MEARGDARSKCQKILNADYVALIFLLLASNFYSALVINGSQHARNARNGNEIATTEIMGTHLEMPLPSQKKSSISCNFCCSLKEAFETFCDFSEAQRKNSTQNRIVHWPQRKCMTQPFGKKSLHTIGKIGCNRGNAIGLLRKQDWCFMVYVTERLFHFRGIFHKIILANKFNSCARIQ